MIRVVYVVALSLLANGAAWASNINIDYHDGAGSAAGVAAAGEGGVWNTLLAADTMNGVGRALVDTNGQSTGVTATHSNLGFFVAPRAATGDAQLGALIDDYAGSVGPPLVIDFAGLEPGVYEVFSYMVTRQDFPATQTSTINDDAATAQTTTGVWTGVLTEGQSHTRHVVEVPQGELRLTISDGNDPILNGIQLQFVRAIPEPCASALAGLFIATVAGKKRRSVKS